MVEHPTAPASVTAGSGSADLAEFNRWLSVTRLRAAGGIACFVSTLPLWSPTAIDVPVVLAVCVMLAGFSYLGLRTSLPQRLPRVFYYLQGAVDLGGITVAIVIGTDGPIAVLFSTMYVMVIVPMGLTSIVSGLVAVAASSACYFLVLGIEFGWKPDTFASLEAWAFPVLFFLVVQQCFFYATHLAQKNVALGALASRLEDNQGAIEDQAEMSRTLFDVARTLATTLDAPELLNRLNTTTRTRLGADFAATFLVDDERGALRLAATSRDDAAIDDLTRFEFPLGGWPVVARLRHEPVVRLTREEASTIPVVFGGSDEIGTVVLAGFHNANALVGFLALGFRELDVTGRKRAEKFLPGIAQHVSIVLRNARLLEEVQLSSDMKSEFVGAISHELRSPLNVTLGYLEMISDEALGPVTADQQEALDRVRRESTALLEMISALLDLNRLEAGRVPIQRERVDLDALLHETVDQVPAQWRSDAVAIRVDAEVDLPEVQTDAGKLKTIIRNLVHNALKFTERGWVSLSAMRAPDGGVQITVRDTGRGIPAEAQAYIFDMFRQVPGSGGSGVGLGLHLVRRLVDLLGGTVSVESTVGLGTAFTIALPDAQVVEPDSGREQAA